MVKKFDVILSNVLKNIKPSSKDRLVADVFVSELNSLLKKHNIGAVAVLGGSMAKDTFLRVDSDADVFVKFNISYKGKDISGLLGSLLDKEGFVFNRVKGSRDYFHINKGFLFELVPVLDVSNIKDADNVIDMSPLHVDYFKLRGKGLEDEVRLLKKFLKANRAYGAESFINGFSGHVVDLLVIKYGSFLKVLRAASSWVPVVVIDIEHKLKNPLLELDKSKISGPLVLVDPVQDNRNAAAALGFDCFNIFVKCAKSFLNNPSDDFFVFKSAKDIISKDSIGKEVFLFEFNIMPLSGSDDVVGAKVLKILEFFQRELESNDFVLKNLKWDFGFPCRAYFLLKNISVVEKKIVRGPPVSENIHCVSFKEKHDITFEKDGFLFSEQKRKHLSVVSLFNSLLNEAYVKERCISISFVKAS